MPVNQNKATGPELLPETSVIQPGSDGMKGGEGRAGKSQGQKQGNSLIGRGGHGKPQGQGGVPWVGECPSGEEVP